MQAQSLIRTSRSIMLRPFHLRHTRGQVRTLNTDPLPPNLSGPEFIRHVLSELSKHADRIGDRITTRLVLTVVSLAVGVDIGVQSLLFGRTLTDIKKQTDKIPEIMEKQAHLEGIMEGMRSDVQRLVTLQNPLAHDIEQVGQAVDSTAGATTKLTRSNANFGASLQEYVQYSKTVDKLLKWRHKKHVEYETLADQLIYKPASLTKLEASEAEAQRLSGVLRAEGATTAHHIRTQSNSSATGGGLMATLNSFIDNDPALTRHKEQIAVLEKQLAV